MVSAGGRGTGPLGIFIFRTLPPPPNPMRLEIRDARSSDRAHLIRCLDAMQDHMVELDSWNRITRTRDHGSVNLAKLYGHIRRNAGFILVAEADGVPAAAAFAYLRPLSLAERTAERPTRSGYLSDLSVLPGWQGLGIGTRLLREVESRFRREGCDQVGLGVFVPNQGAQRLYQRVGYSPRSIFMVKRLGPARRRWPRARRR